MTAFVKSGGADSETFQATFAEVVNFLQLPPVVTVRWPVGIQKAAFYGNLRISDHSRFWSMISTEEITRQFPDDDPVNTQTDLVALRLVSLTDPQVEGIEKTTAGAAAAITDLLSAARVADSAA